MFTKVAVYDAILIITEVRGDWKNVQQVGLHLGYISRAFGAPSSQINEDISKKTDFASN